MRAPSTVSARPPQADEQTRRAWQVLSVTSIGMVLTYLNTSTLNVALPTLARHYHSGPTATSWFVLAYQITTTTLILPFGRLTDIAGRKRLYVSGLALIATASLASAFAPDAATLITLRALQGIGGACVLANTTALLVDAFPSRLLATGLGLNVTAAAAAGVLGPVVGGGLLATLGWRSIFWFNAPIGAIGLWWAIRTLPAGRAAASRERERFDLPGAALAATVLLGLVLLASRAGGPSGIDALGLTYGLVALCTLVLLIVVERRRPDPLIDLTLLRHRGRSMAYAATTLMSTAQASLPLLVALFLQNVQGVAPFQAGLWITPLAAATMLASPIMGRLAGRFDPRLLTTTGFALVGTGVLWLALSLSVDSSRPMLIVILGITGLGSGLFQAPNTAALMAGVPHDRRGIAGSLRTTLQNTGQMISVSVCLAIVAAAVPTSAQGDVVAGTGGSLLGRTVDGFRWAFLAMSFVCVVGGVTSAARGSRSR